VCVCIIFSTRNAFMNRYLSAGLGTQTQRRQERQHEIHPRKRDGQTGLGGRIPGHFGWWILAHGRRTFRRRRPVRPGGHRERGRQSTATRVVLHVQVRPATESATQPFDICQTVRDNGFSFRFSYKI